MLPTTRPRHAGAEAPHSRSFNLQWAQGTQCSMVETSVKVTRGVPRALLHVITQGLLHTENREEKEQEEEEQEEEVQEEEEG